MDISETKFREVKLIKNFCAEDERGKFIKLYNNAEFKKFGLHTDFKESYYSISNKGTIRGMHFQLPPYEHAKLVHVLQGAVRDIIVDLRKGSMDYGRCMEITLHAEQPAALFIPAGFAHGFLSLNDDTIMLYYVTSGYQKKYDTGIRWDSITYNWGIDKPIISERDQTFPKLQEFKTPF